MYRPDTTTCAANAKRIRGLLLIHGEDFTTVAKATGKSQVTVSKVARRELRTPEVIDEFCRILDTTEADLWPASEFEEKNRATA